MWWPLSRAACTSVLSQPADTMPHHGWLVGGFVACGSGHCVQIMAASTADVAWCSIAQLQAILDYWAGSRHLAAGYCVHAPPWLAPGQQFPGTCRRGARHD